MDYQMSCSLLLHLVLGSFCIGAHGSLAEYNLLQGLFENYNPSNRPVANVNDAVQVTMDMAIHQIIDLDETREMLKTKLWMRLAWQDAHLQWNPPDHGMISQINVPPATIWKPDITLYQDVSEMSSVYNYRQNFPVAITSQGHVTWSVPYVFYSSCNLDVRYFPFDEQKCPLKFGSWTFPASSLNLTSLSDTADLSEYVCNGEWQLMGLPVVRNLDSYGIHEYVDLNYVVIIRRMPLYYMFNLVFPCLVITCTAILVFCLPPESGEKVNLGVTVLLALTVFLLLVAQSVPSQSTTVPLAGEYFAATIVILALSTAMTVVSLNIHHRGSFGTEPPVLMRIVFLDWLATCVFMKSHVVRYRQETGQSQGLDRKSSGNQKGTEFAGNYENGTRCAPIQPTINRTAYSTAIQDTNSALNPSLLDFPLADTTSRPTSGSSHTHAWRMERHLEQIVDILKDGRQSWEEQKVVRSRITEWALVSMVVDRLLFALFLVLTAVVSLSILLQRPSYTELPTTCHRE